MIVSYFYSSSYSIFYTQHHTQKTFEGERSTYKNYISSVTFGHLEHRHPIPYLETSRVLSTTGSYNILMFESYVFIFFVFSLQHCVLCCDAAVLCDAVGGCFCVPQARKFFVFLSITFSKQRIEILNVLWFKKKPSISCTFSASTSTVIAVVQINILHYILHNRFSSLVACHILHGNCKMNSPLRNQFVYLCLAKNHGSS